jgi:hypothetical protein
MRITQVFASADDERVISELEISPDQATSVPVAGDRVRWVVNDRIYTGRVKSSHLQIAAHWPGPTAYDTVSRSRCPVPVIRGETAASS